MRLVKIILTGVVILSLSKFGHAIQPPPPPLTLSQFQQLIAESGVIAIGEVIQVANSEKSSDRVKEVTTTVILRPEKILKGETTGKDILIIETYPDYDSVTTDLTSKKSEGGPMAIVSMNAGPRPYHGRYKEGSRIIIFLEEVTGTNEYRPLGSGTYDKYLCEFLIKTSGIQTIYYQFDDDLKKHAQSEDEFVGLIKKTIGKELKTLKIRDQIFNR